MSARGGSERERERSRQLAERCSRLLGDLLRHDDNKYCVDCDAKGPRWASWNIGVFLCIRCAGIHRNLGVHISKVKSVNLDSWTPEQVVSLQQMGNSRARAVYEANLPDAFRRPQTDSALEAFIRAKYEHRKYLAHEWVPPDPPKVNWDKEIDEELDKQKKKKKSSSSAPLAPPTSSASVEKKNNKAANAVPKLLPKPKSSASPKPGRATPKRDSGGTADLLGTNTTETSNEASSQNNLTDDMFSSFLSAPQLPSQDANRNTDPKEADLKSEEESFFNQPAPSEKEKSKMTKDSIMALYGQAPPVNQFPQPNGGFNAQFPQPINQFGLNYPAQNMFAQNGMQGNNMGQNFQGFSQFGAAPMPPMNGQFASYPAQNQTAPSQFPAMGQFTSSTAFPASAGVHQAFSNVSNLSQQFGGLTMTQNGQSASAFGAQPNSFPSATRPNVAADAVWP